MAKKKKFRYEIVVLNHLGNFNYRAYGEFMLNV